ncbi:MAG: hypothetical protein ABFD91_04120 [Anaerohalosphaeraceae bacterium]
MKIHCKGAMIHFNAPVCGKKLDGEKVVSRKEFCRVKHENQCQACRRTRWARGI